MSRKKHEQRTTLNDLLWRRVDEILERTGQRRSELWKKMRRNKNTYTNWVKRRTILQISDLEEIAEALGVPASDLLRETDAAGDRVVALVSGRTEPELTVGLELQVSAQGLRIRLKE